MLSRRSGNLALSTVRGKPTPHQARYARATARAKMGLAAASPPSLSLKGFLDGDLAVPVTTVWRIGDLLAHSFRQETIDTLAVFP